MKSKFQLIIRACVIILIINHISADEEKKKLKIVLDKLEKVKDAEHILKTELTFDKDGEEVKINGVVEQSVDLDDNYKLTFDILYSKESDGEFKMVINKVDMGVCDVMKNQYKKYFYDTLKEHCNAPDPDTCPVTKEKYEVNNYPIDSSKFAAYLRPGFYHIVSTLKHNDEEVLQYRVEAHTEVDEN